MTTRCRRTLRAGPPRSPSMTTRSCRCRTNCRPCRRGWRWQAITLARLASPRSSTSRPSRRTESLKVPGVPAVPEVPAVPNLRNPRNPRNIRNPRNTRNPGLGAMIRHMRLLTALLVLFFAAPSWAQPPQRQTQEDDYTRYELLGPDTAQFRILYEVTATTAGAPYFFNAIRKGSIATDESVVDLMTGQSLKWEIVSGAQARKEGHPTADLETEWLKVYLARPVPKGGEGRVLIDKTYKDPKR